MNKIGRIAARFIGFKLNREQEMNKVTTVVEAAALTANTAGVEQNVSPDLEGNVVRFDIIPNAFSGTAILQGSVDNTTWTTLKTTGALTTSSVPLVGQVTLPKYIRSNVTRSAGSVSIYITAGY
jgi:hypothetical protein